MIPTVSLTVRPRATPPALADLEADLDRPVSLTRYELDVRADGFLEASVTQSINAFAASWTINYAASTSEAELGLVIEAGDGVTLDVGGEPDPWIEGWVDSDSHDVGPGTEKRAIKGRSLLGDLADCSARITGRPHRFRDVTLQDLVRALVDEYSIDVIDGVGPLEPFPLFELKKSERIGKAIRRACRARGVWTLDRGGKLALTRSGSHRTRTRLVTGENVLKASRTRDFRQRFGQYRFAGAAAFRDLTSIRRVGGVEVEVRSQESYSARVLRSAEVASEVEDPGVGRLRRLQVTTRRRNTGDISARALLERQQRAGRSERYQLELDSWHNDEGVMWLPGTIVHFRDERLGADAEFVVATVTHRVRLTTGGHYRTGLTLMPPHAFDVLQDLTIPRRGGTDGR